MVQKGRLHACPTAELKFGTSIRMFLVTIDPIERKDMATI